MGRLFIETLSSPKIFKCKCCKVDSASHSDIVSKEFQGRLGRAYLFRNVVNVSVGPSEERHLMSGLHIVRDIYCSSCQQILGWRYSKSDVQGREWENYYDSSSKLVGNFSRTDKAYEISEKYKEGLYILERERMVKEDR